MIDLLTEIKNLLECIQNEQVPRQELLAIQKKLTLLNSSAMINETLNNLVTTDKEIELANLISCARLLSELLNFKTQT
jgi:hypothetical protein